MPDIIAAGSKTKRAGLITPLFLVVAKKSVYYFATFVVTGFSFAADVRESDTRILLSPSLLYFDYTEFNKADEVLDRELGWLNGVEIRLDHALTTRWSANIYTTFFTGNVDYTGQTQQNAPHNTDSDTRLFRLGAKAETDIYKATRLFLGVQSHQWVRDIQDTGNVSGISEEYRWLEYTVGIKSGFDIDQRNALNFEIAYLITRDASIDVDLSRVNFGSAKLDIGDGSGGRFTLNWRRVTDSNMHYGLTFFHEAWDFGRSNTKATQGGSSSVLVTEPRSQTRLTVIQFNIEYRF